SRPAVRARATVHPANGRALRGVSSDHPPRDQQNWRDPADQGRPRRVPRQITTRPGPVPHRPARACGVAGSARTDLIPPLFPAVEVPMSAPTLDAAVHIPFATYPDSTTATLPVMT